MTSLGDDSFRGTPRFSLERRLGAGAFGVVYRVFDRERGAAVALKTLRPGNEEALYRLKREFRSLADIAHPNLVRLHELLSERDQWFFTMELVEGCNFLEYVEGAPSRTDARPDGSWNESTHTLSLPEDIEEKRVGLRKSPGFAWICPDQTRLREVLRQTVTGISALHEAGKLHRDIKPSNVLVSREGRVVLLDFGLATDLSTASGEGSVALAGTPTYMSPEQCVGRSVSEPSDWYSLGVMLFEALTARSPFTGSFFEMYEQKRREDPPAPGNLVADIPEDLNRLCRDLLRPAPKSRPTGREILERLDGLLLDTPLRASRPVVLPRSAPFVGRSEQLARLHRAFDDSRKGRCVTALVHGGSGMGKTALVRKFLGEVSPHSDVVVLAGRCYEHESVPYKALDSLVDALSQYLKRLPPEQADALMPRDVLALARLFPVLRRVDAIANARRYVLEIPDAQELRRRAFAALRELIGRLADRKSLLLFIDDLHWGDVDSAALLADLLRPPDAPAVLWIAAYRTEEAETSPLLRKLLPLKPFSSEGSTILVSELAAIEARDLTRALLAESSKLSTASADAIAREAAGNPFLIHELAAYARGGEDRLTLAAVENADESSSGATLDRLIRARVSVLPEKSRRFLEIVAVAGRPLDAGVAREAAAIPVRDDPADALRAAHLVRTRGTDHREEVEIYHDRIRDTIVNLLSAEEVRDRQRRLAQALEASGGSDPEALALHYREAGELARAAEFAPLAAERAVQALAFDRAARLFHLSLELHGPEEDERKRELRIKLGDALANAGRGAEAASAYLAALRGASTAQAIELQRRAAEQLLRAGHLDVGLPVLREVLTRVGLRLTDGPWAALFHFLMRRAAIRLRGLEYRERDATQVPEEELIRIDACWSASIGLAMVDTIRGRDFQARHLLLALKAGETYRVARAVANEAGYLATSGHKTQKRTQEVVRRAVALAERVGKPQAIGVAQLAVGITAYLEGRWKASWELAQQAEQILRERCTGVAWELDTIHVYSLRALYYLGEIAELSARLPILIKEAEERDDLFAATTLRARHAHIAGLAADQPDRAAKEIRAAIDGWTRHGFHFQHFSALIAETEIALYQGDAKGALNLLTESWAALVRSRLLRVQVFRVEALHLRARCSIAAARTEEDFSRAERDASRVEREGIPWADSLANLLFGGIASARGQRDVALARLAKAEKGFVSSDMTLYAFVARRRRGEVLGDGGRDLVSSADDWMSRQGIRSPAHMTDMLAPMIRRGGGGFVSLA